MIQFNEITKENFWEVIELSVAPSQNEFVTSNAVSIAQAKVQPECVPLAIYDNDQLIGFLMYCIDADDGEYWIYRMMIDQRFQSKGYGKQALSLLIELIRQDESHQRIFLGVHPESVAAVKIYQSAGFEFTGQVFGSEHIMVMDKDR